MKLPINWLKDYITVPENPKVLMEKMTSIGHMQDGPAKEVSGDVVYDLEIRQNRSDCLSILGLAREAAAVLNTELKLPESLEKELPDVPSTFKLAILNPELCFRFQTVTIDNVKVAPSPDWLVKKLEAYGVKSINNIVDITNFVMIELGEPTHAYDARTIKDRMDVRIAKDGEKVTVLGGREVKLTEHDLVIADSEKVLAVAGVIGGENSGIKNDTTTIILEDAAYNQAAIRRTSIRHAVRTEASTRHEKFLHPHLTTLTLRRAVQLILELAGGSVVDHVDLYPTKTEEKALELNVYHLYALGGVEIAETQVEDILNKLGIQVTESLDHILTVKVPYFRTDLLQEADLIEEVLRIYGYDNLPATLPKSPPPEDLQPKSTYDVEEKIKDILTACGFDEQITEPLTKEEQPLLDPVILENSLNADKTMLRTTMKHNLMQVLENQKKYRKFDIRVFEIGKIYYKEGNKYVEEKIIAGLCSYPTNSFSHVKGVIELLFERIQFEFNSNVVKIVPLSDTSYYFEVKLADLLSQKQIKGANQIFTSPPQVILQDLSFSAPVEVKVGEVITKVKEISSLIYKIDLGEPPQKLKDGNKSIFLKVAFYSKDKKITSEDVEPERKKIIKELEEQFGIKVR